MSDDLRAVASWPGPGPQRSSCPVMMSVRRRNFGIGRDS